MANCSHICATCSASIGGQEDVCMYCDKAFSGSRHVFCFCCTYSCWQCSQCAAKRGIDLETYYTTNEIRDGLICLACKRKKSSR